MAGVTAPSKVEPIVFKANYTQKLVIECDAQYVIVVSNRGGGKTTSATIANYHWAMKRHIEQGMELPVRYAVIRDTRRNIGRTVAKTIKQWFLPNVMSFWRGKEEEPEYCTIKNGKYGTVLEYYFIGCDNPSDLDIFQSFEIGGLWVVEPAPAGTESSGIDVGVFAMGVSSLRQNPWPRTMIEFNHPPPDHWLCQLWPDVLPHPELAMPKEHVPPEVLARFRGKSAIFKIPTKENAAEKKQPGYLQDMRDAFLVSDRPDLAARLVDGIVADVQIGEPVTPEFDESLFVVPSLAPIRPGERLLASWDGGHQPACIIWRPRPGYALEVLAAFQADHAGMRQFLQSKVLPWAAVHVPEGVRWQHTGDPNLKTGDMGNSEESAQLAICELLPPSSGTPYRGREYDLRPILDRGNWNDGPMIGSGGWVPGPVSKHNREQPVHDVLNPAWRPPLRIDQRYGQPLIRALNGQWRRKKDPAGKMIAEDWMKNLEANTAEAFAYGCALLAKGRTAQDVRERFRQQVQRNQQSVDAGDGTNV